MIRKALKKIFAIIVFATLAQSSALMIRRPRRSTDACGVSKIQFELTGNGQSFPRGSFPWVVALMFKHTIGFCSFCPTVTEYLCAGTLISKTFVVSAAHCLMEEETKKTLLPRDVLALFGAHKLSDGFETGRIKQSPKKIYIHDEWNHLKVRNNADVSLLEFWGNKITFGDFVQPICLWESENEPTVTEGVATGWIKIESLMESRDNFPKLVQAPIQSNNECFLDEDRLVDQSRTTFCSGILNGSGVCNGDSGGGLFIIVDGIFYLKGIMSLSLIEDDGCDVSKNAVYTNFLKFKDWMKDIAAKAVKKVFCIFQKNYGTINCIVTEAIDSEDYVLGSKRNTSIELFNVTDNRLLQFLPRHIGKKLPNLKDFLAWNCRLTVVRDFYFKNVGSLEFLSLADNQIATIEANAFDDLVSLRLLRLQNNLIETLDEKLFEKLVNMREISLLGNKIKFLSATTFQLLGGKLYLVDLRWNVCIDQGYKMIQNLNQIESDLRANCTK